MSYASRKGRDMATVPPTSCPPIVPCETYKRRSSCETMMAAEPRRQAGGKVVLMCQELLAGWYIVGKLAGIGGHDP
jgi:hypothetical protein